MRDLRFIQQDTTVPIPEDLKETVEEFHEQGKAFNQTYEQARKDKAEYEKLKQKKDNAWKDFKHSFLLLAKGRCTICESPINKYDDIEHYRPKEHYWWLAYDYRNYSIYCALCNRTYKRTDFPLCTDFQVDFENRDEVAKEQPLLFNPITDNPCDLFELEFLPFSPQGGNGHLKIKPLSSNDKASYAYKKAKTTIDQFNLNGELNDKNPIDTITRQRHTEDLFADLYNLACFWKRYIANTKDKETEKQFFNKLKLIRVESFPSLKNQKK